MNFYVINNHLFDDSTSAFGQDFGNINLGPAKTCEVCGSKLTGLEWLPPHEIEVSRTRLGDFIFGTFDNFIVSSRVKTLFLRTELKGIRSFSPVTIFYRRRVSDKRYYYPRITMSDVHIDLEKSGFEFDGTKRCPACQKAGSIVKKWDGLIFENTDSIELDIFNTKVLPGVVCVSERFRDFVIGQKFSNISMIEASKYGTPWTTSA